MTTLTTFQNRSYSSLLSRKTKCFALAAVSMFLGSFPFQLKAQCPPDLFISGSTTGTWQAPATGGPWEVQITALGAGGGAAGGGNAGGSGAEIIGTFVVQNGQTILATSGGPGGAGTGNSEGGGGSGSGAVNCNNPANCATGVILIIAAAGNGGEDEGSGLGGTAAVGGPGGGGAGGGSNGGGGGGGNGGNGSSGTGGQSGTGGNQITTVGISLGGPGSDTNNKGGDGMGGGGGGGNGNTNGSGGGAGHIGAGGGNNAGATSFNSGTNQQGSDGTQGGGDNPGSVLVSCLGSLPIELIDFKALIQTEGIRLLWSTATEKNNLGYDIERSADNRKWGTLGFVPGSGTTTSRKDYGFLDENPLTGINYYRLKQMDADGKFEYTPIVVADLRSGGLQFNIFPNPSTTGDLSVRTVSNVEGDALLEVYDWAGYKVYKNTLQVLKGTAIYPLPMNTFPKGAYTARLEMPDGTVQFKKVVLH